MTNNKSGSICKRCWELLFSLGKGSLCLCMFFFCDLFDLLWGVDIKVISFSDDDDDILDDR
jgi:hypothetical protein